MTSCDILPVFLSATGDRIRLYTKDSVTGVYNTQQYTNIYTKSTNDLNERISYIMLNIITYCLEIICIV